MNPRRPDPPVLRVHPLVRHPGETATITLELLAACADLPEIRVEHRDEPDSVWVAATTKRISVGLTTLTVADLGTHVQVAWGPHRVRLAPGCGERRE